jgi:hypothetical protein
MKIINIEVNRNKKTFSVDTDDSTYSYPFVSGGSQNAPLMGS